MPVRLEASGGWVALEGAGCIQAGGIQGPEQPSPWGPRPFLEFSMVGPHELSPWESHI